MFFRLLKSTFVLLLFFTAFAGSAFASGKMEVPLSQKVTLKTESAGPNAVYKWVVRKGSDIINTQVGTVFNYEFEQQGEHLVNLTVQGGDQVIRTTSIVVLVGDRFPRPGSAPSASAPNVFEVTALPPIEDGRIHVVGDSAVLFHMEADPDVLEYRVDRNVFEDSDKNGVADDDIDNAGDDSYLRGGYFQVSYVPEAQKKVVAEITAVYRDGRKVKKQAEVIFDAPPAREADPVATLNTIPAPDPSDQAVYLYGEEGTVGFYIEKSAGNIIEYRLDRNIFADSDGDGDPGNDIDNLNHVSFKTGDVWQATYRKTDGRIIAQAIVVTADGRGSRIQRAIEFRDTPAIIVPEGIALVADKPFVLIGNPVVFTVKGLQLAPDRYTFLWDIDGDGTADKQVDGQNTLEHIFETPGLFRVAVKVTDTDGNSGKFELEIPVRETVRTAADFEFAVDGNTVTFTDKSTAAFELSDKTLLYDWSFGDTDEAGYNAQKGQLGLPNPVYTYAKAGRYSVTLKVTDADQVASSKTAEIVIESDLPAGELPGAVEPSDEEETSPSGERGKSLLVTILKVFLYILLSILALSVFILIGFLAFFKLQHPELSFDEVIDALKAKALAALGMDDLVEPRPAPAPIPVPPAPVPAQEPTPQKATAPTPPKATKTESPVTHAGKEVIEAELEMETPAVPAKTPAAAAPLGGQAAPASADFSQKGPAVPPPLNKQDGPVPDWLKGIQ